ncbi:NAD-dependent epimerase/dehydratase [Candidatus Protofrankia californiensis]|uniref:NAD-dependent epimerase/dehydratase n=1 Tax=Candidatus Protofrankia californiensis TaxID=1839754 RepID=A0A1C3PAJ3_9ACTN|nr:NAD-dependent epimerase/dehydratase [Candidatus Protofrankia californiensis]
MLQGLLERGHDVTMLHRGVHEPVELPDVPHIHADPHFAETLSEATEGRSFDVVLAMYGRVFAIAQVFAGRCGQLVSIGDVPAYRGCLEPATVTPYGMAVNAREDGPLADEAEPVPRFARPIRAAERAVLDRAHQGVFRGTVVRYPPIYGPRNLVPWEWSVIRRVLDGRTRMILPDDGLGIISRCAGRNAAEVVLKVVDHPDVADGQAYNAADDDQFSIRQWAEAVSAIMGVRMKFVGLPSELAGSALVELLPPSGRPHILVDNNKAKRELGYREVIAAADALVEAVDWIRRHPVTREDYPLYPARFDYEAEDRLIAAYTRAVEWVRERAPDVAPQLRHPMPHPKTATVGRDESGR